MQIAPFELERFFARYEYEVPYTLCASGCEPLTVAELLALEPGAEAEFMRLGLGYPETQGTTPFRDAVASQYDVIQPEQVLVHSGSSEGIFNAMNALLKPGDHVIVHFPCYQSLYEVARANGCEVTWWEATEATDWEMDLEALKGHIRTNTKAIVINCPHNPTGYLMPQAQLEQLVVIARERGLILFSDEVYRELEHDASRRLPAVCDIYERGVSLGSLSKAYGLPGLRLGWVATQDETLYQAIAAFKDYTTICTSGPSQFLGTVAVRHRARIFQRNLAIIHQNLAHLEAFFKKHAALFEWKQPTSGAVGFPRLKSEALGGLKVEDFARQLIEQEGVLVLPSRYYYCDPQFFRIGFGRLDMQDGLTRLDSYLERLLQTKALLPAP